MKKVILALNIVLTLSVNVASAEFLYKNFDESMHTPASTHQKPSYTLLKEIYEKNNPKILKKNRNVIPKIIHQIWLGPRPISKEYQANSQKWQELHPGWSYKIWREDDINKWNFPSKDLFYKASSYQEKSDILRYEILKKYGGLYVDMDYRPIKSFDEVHQKYTFYASIEPVHSEKVDVTIANSILASVPNNKIFDISLKQIRQHWDQEELNFRKAAIDMKEKNLIHLAVNRTMMPLHNAILANISSIDGAIVFPTSYMSIEERDNFLDKPKIFLGLVDSKLYFRIPKEETMSIQKRGSRKIDNISNVSFKEPWYKFFASGSDD
jgi:hypothetical protein